MIHEPDIVKRGIKLLLPLLVLAWAIYAFVLLWGTGNFELLLLYQVYLAYLALVFYWCRDNLLNPVGASMLVGFLAFGNNIPMFSRGMILNEFVDSKLLFAVLAIFMVAQVSFILGTRIKISRTSPFRFLFDSKYAEVDVNSMRLIALTIVVAIVGAFRIRFHIGAAKDIATISYAGYFHYALLDGLLFCSLWFLGKALQKSRSLTVLAFAPLLGIVLTQALLGWRGMIFRVVICVGTVFWFQRRLYKSDQIRSLGWLFLIAIVGFSSIQIGQRVRSERAGMDESFADSPTEWIENVQHRSQGTTRLANVVRHTGGLSLTNDFFILKLIKRGESATQYVNRVLYGVQAHQKHSVGCSGPGSLYLAAGLIGVASSFLLWGSFVQAVYDNISFERIGEFNIVAVAFYASILGLMQYSYAEGFDIGFLKRMFAITAIALGCKWFIFSSRRRIQYPHPVQAGIGQVGIR